MLTAGLDIGSRSIELVMVDSLSGEILSSQEKETTPDIEAVCREMMDRKSFDRLIVTGYGRSLAEVAFGFSSVTEIKAYARGAADYDAVMLAIGLHVGRSSRVPGSNHKQVRIAVDLLRAIAEGRKFTVPRRM